MVYRVSYAVVSDVITSSVSHCLYSEMNPEKMEILVKDIWEVSCQRDFLSMTCGDFETPCCQDKVYGSDKGETKCMICIFLNRFAECSFNVIFSYHCVENGK